MKKIAAIIAATIVATMCITSASAAACSCGGVLAGIGCAGYNYEDVEDCSADTDYDCEVVTRYYWTYTECQRCGATATNRDTHVEFVGHREAGSSFFLEAAYVCPWM